MLLSLKEIMAEKSGGVKAKMIMEKGSKEQTVFSGQRKKKTPYFDTTMSLPPVFLENH